MGRHVTSAFAKTRATRPERRVTPRSMFAAVDLGATSGRVILGEAGGGRLRIRTVARFQNAPVRLGDGLHWNMLEIYRQVLTGLATAERQAAGEITSVGIDSWGCDYGLLRQDHLLGVPFAYRDERGAQATPRVHRAIGASDLYRRNGLQHLPFNTIFQLVADGDLLGYADRMLQIPDLLAYLLTGGQASERTIASTSGLLDASTREWDTELAAAVGIPRTILAPLVDSGTEIGAFLPEPSAVVGASLSVVAVGAHDTASAIVGVPSAARDFAYISCGTWGLAGVELDTPILTDDARLGGFTNEGGVDGRIQFHRNVMGLWLLTESMRTWDPLADGELSYMSGLLDAAGRVRAPVAIFDVDDDRFLSPGDMPSRIADWCREHDVEPPRTPAEFVRSIIESLAVAFANAVEVAARIAGHDVRAIHLVGGGAQNALLCQATADRARIPVIAGPVEATAIGNILVQARKARVVDEDLDGLRSVVAATFPLVRYEPGGRRLKTG